MRRHFVLPLALLLHGARAQSLPLDPQATPETRNLYLSLHRMTRQGIMFGHQDDLAYGARWQYQPGRSDVREVAGESPAGFGWELGRMVETPRALGQEKHKVWAVTETSLGGLPVADCWTQAVLPIVRPACSTCSCGAMLTGSSFCALSRPDFGRQFSSVLPRLGGSARAKGGGPAYLRGPANLEE